jgi:LmbE family N-acetylglucosaminyl deacetylase
MRCSGTLVVLSPHLDDAVLSLGAFLHLEARRGVDVRVVTVFANDPARDGPAGRWDATCGFHSAATAARARRLEDRRACGIIGADPQWLPFVDDTYGGRSAPDAIWDRIRGLIDGCELVLVPGFPLWHADHASLTQLVVERRTEVGCPLGFYAEQPYASRARAMPAGFDFDPLPAGLTDRYAKLRAVLQYRSQLRALGARLLVRALAAGERISVPVAVE